MELTVEQQKALALARARVRVKQPSARDELLGKRAALDEQLENSTLTGTAGLIGRDLDENVRLAASGMSLGFLDKALGGDERARTNLARERQGYTGMASEIGGSLLPAGVLAKGIGAAGLSGKGIKGLSGLVARTGSMAGQGGALGAASALGNDQDVRTGAAIGAAGGAAGNLAGETITTLGSKAAGFFAPKVKAMTLGELKQAGQKAYDTAKTDDVIFKSEAINKLRKAIYDDFADFGFHPKNQPGAAVAYEEISRLAEGGNVSMKGLETARKIAQGGFDPTKPSNNELIRRVAQHIDDFAENAHPKDVMTGDPAQAITALKQARDLWSRFRKTEKVEELLARGKVNAGSTGSGGNVENATRQQLKRILTNPKTTRGFTPDEIDATRKAVLGTRGQNALRLAGKLSPQGNGLMAFLMGGGAVAAPHIAIPAALGGMAAKKVAEGMTDANAEMLKKIIATGGKRALAETPKTAFQKAIEAQREMLARSMMMTAIGSQRP